MKDLVIKGKTSNGSFTMSPMQLQLKRNWLKAHKDETEISMTLSDKKPKSKKQLGAHFGLAINTIIEEFDSRGWDSSVIYKLEKNNGVGVYVDMLQNYFYALYPTFYEGKWITMSDQNFSSADESRFFEAIRNHAASQWSIYIPEPNPEWKTEKE